jgi:hypothetical protein
MKRKTPELPPVVVGPCKETQGEDVATAIGRDDAKLIDKLVDRFLAWPLPESVCSDLCVTDRKYKFPRSGTNLLTADEARAMFQHVLKGLT